MKTGGLKIHNHCHSNIPTFESNVIFIDGDITYGAIRFYHQPFKLYFSFFSICHLIDGTHPRWWNGKKLEQNEIFLILIKVFAVVNITYLLPFALCLLFGIQPKRFWNNKQCRQQQTVLNCICVSIKSNFRLMNKLQSIEQLNIFQKHSVSKIVFLLRLTMAHVKRQCYYDQNSNENQFKNMPYKITSELFSDIFLFLTLSRFFGSRTFYVNGE